MKNNTSDTKLSQELRGIIHQAFTFSSGYDVNKYIAKDLEPYVEQINILFEKHLAMERKCSHKEVNYECPCWFEGYNMGDSEGRAVVAKSPEGTIPEECTCSIDFNSPHHRYNAYGCSIHDLIHDK